MTPITRIFKAVHDWHRHGQVKRNSFLPSSYGEPGATPVKDDGPAYPLVSIGPSGIGGHYQTEIDVKE